VRRAQGAKGVEASQRLLFLDEIAGSSFSSLQSYYCFHRHYTAFLLNIGCKLKITGLKS